jgi:hypothetical protein
MSEGKKHYDYHNVGEWIILRWILDMMGGFMEWTDMVQDRGQWRAPVNKETRFRMPQSVGEFLSY